MSEILLFVALGLAAGSVYALAGVGLVLTFKTSGVFNFAHGAVATIGAYTFFELFVSRGMGWEIAALISIVGVGLVLGLLLEPFARRLRNVSLPLQVAGSVGLLLVIQALVALLYPDEELRRVPGYLMEGGFTLFDAPIQWSDAVTFLVALTVTAVVTLVLRRTRAGVVTRALVDSDELLSLNRINPNAVRRGVWVVGSMLAATSGVLFAPLLPLNSVQLTLIVISAFGAAAVGGFSSLWLTFGGGLLIGVGASLATRYLMQPVFTGLAPSLPFLVLFAVILLTRRPGRAFKAPVPFRGDASWTAPVPVQMGLGVLLVVFLASVPTFAGIHLTEWTAALGGIVLFLSLALLVRTSGQVSLCHVSFMAIGATGFSHLTTDQGVPWFLALVIAGLLAVPVGAILAIPAIRLSGLHLALATFGFGVVFQYLFYTRDFMFGATQAGGLPMPRPHVGGEALGDVGYFYLALLVAGLAAVAVLVLVRGRLGRLLRGIGNAPVALETTGAAVNVTRVIVFCISAFLAAEAGAIIGVARTTVSANDFQPMMSLTFLVLIIIVIGRAPWDAVLAGIALYVVPSYVSGGDVPIYLQLVFGVSAVLLAVAPPTVGGPPAPVQRVLDRTFRRPGNAQVVRDKAGTAPRAAVERRRGGTGLEMTDIVVRFGGLVAVDGVSLAVPLGRVTGLIGPNGAGKTTLFNAASGLVQPTRGRIVLDGREITRSRPESRARAGLGRTFQDMQLFESLTVRQNVSLGREGAFAIWNPLTHLGSTPAASRLVQAATEEAIELCGIGDIAHLPVHGLSTGQRRLVDLARCLAGNHKVLLMDEPSSGLDVHESQELGNVVRRVVDERGVGVLLVEHDLSLVLDLCEEIYVVDFGKLIFRGTPSEVTASPIVRAAYLGDDELDELIGHDPDSAAPVGAR